MGKHACCICQKDVGLFTGKSVLKDGIICSKCLKAGGISTFPSSRQFTTNHICKIINSRTEAVNNYRATKHLGRIEIDTNNHAFKIDGVFYLFDNLISYAYHEDPDTSRIQNQDGKGSGAAIGSVIGGIRGGVIGGAVGAAVGGAVGSLFSTTCNSMGISITLKDTPISDVYLHFITEKTKTSSSQYTEALKNARACLEALQIIKEENDKQRQSHLQTMRARDSKSGNMQNIFVQDKHFTAKQMAEELDIYKALLYNGDITQEEYDQKRKQLLDLK